MGGVKSYDYLVEAKQDKYWIRHGLKTSAPTVIAYDSDGDMLLVQTSVYSDNVVVVMPWVMEIRYDGELVRRDVDIHRVLCWSSWVTSSSSGATPIPVVPLVLLGF